MKKLLPIFLIFFASCSQETKLSLTKMTDSAALDVIRPKVVKYVDSLKQRNDWAVLNFQLAYDKEYGETGVTPNPLKNLSFNGDRSMVTFHIPIANSVDQYVKDKGHSAFETGIVIKIDSLGTPISHTSWLSYFRGSFIEMRPGEQLYDYMKHK